MAQVKTKQEITKFVLKVLEEKDRTKVLELMLIELCKLHNRVTELEQIIDDED
jgi:hypothetical protein